MPPKQKHSGPGKAHRNNDGSSLDLIDTADFSASSTIPRQLWVIVSWVQGGCLHSIQPVESVVTKEILDDPEKVGEIYVVSEDPNPQKPPHWSKKTYLGRVVAKSEDRVLMNKLLVEIAKLPAGNSAELLKWTMKGDLNSEMCEKRDHPSHDVEESRKSNEDQLAKEIKTLRETVTKLDKELKDQRSVMKDQEARISRLEQQLQELVKKEDEVIEPSAEEIQRQELMQMEAELLKYMKTSDLQQAKQAPFRKMIAKLLESLFGNELVNATVKKLDPEKIQLLTRYVMACRPDEPECSVSMIRSKIRKYLDNKSNYNKRKASGVFLLRKGQFQPKQEEDSSEMDSVRSSGEIDLTRTIPQVIFTDSSSEDELFNEWKKTKL